MFPLSAVVCLSLLALTSATNVRQCKGSSIENLSEDVQLLPCPKVPCKLKRGSVQEITMVFRTNDDIKEIKNNVKAEIAGIYVPFIGVDGASVCDKIYNEAGEKASCPLNRGNKYMYKDSFRVLDFYPTLSVNIHWSLKDVDDNDLTCFEVPAKIVNK